MAAATFAALFIALFTAHTVADHWLQTHTQATTKGGAGWPARLACARHVLTLTITQALAVAGLALFLDLALVPGWVALALVVNAVTHYVVDRRTPLYALADWLERVALVAGKGQFARLGDGASAPCGTGAYSLDQSWHVLWLGIAAAVATIGAG